MPERLFLSRRNLLTLLNKLDRSRTGDVSACIIVKKDLTNARHPCSVETFVTAVEDKDYYFDREPGRVMAVDTPKQA